MKKTLLVKKDGNVEKHTITSTKELNSSCPKGIHLCTNCSKADVNNCAKIEGGFQLTGGFKAKNGKKPIGAYPFIKDGYQIVNEWGELRKFIVTGCDNYERFKATESKYTPEEMEKMYENLILAYYGVETMKEASEIYYYDMEIEQRAKKKIRAKETPEK